jgi:hypothetical protein
MVVVKIGLFSACGHASCSQNIAFMHTSLGTDPENTWVYSLYVLGDVLVSTIDVGFALSLVHVSCIEHTFVVPSSTSRALLCLSH